MEKNILIVDDRPENLIALERLLSDYDCKIFKANSGNEALTLTLSNEFALALIDVQMPDMDGYETVRLLRNVERTKFLPVIFLSAIYSDNHYKIQGIEAGAVDFISKPIHPRILQGKVKIFLQIFEQRKQLELEIEQRKKTEENLRIAEKEISIAKEKAEEADRLKTAFLANMSHEIRTPLNAIVGFSNLLGDTTLTEDKRGLFLQYINNSSEALTTLISDIIDTAKIEAGQLEIILTPVIIPNVLYELYETYKVYLQRLEKGHIELELKLPPEIDSYSLLIDGLRLKQIFSNLITNACKFTEEGKIEFGFYFNNDEQAEFYVKDSGIGISEEQKAFIFDPFRQVPNDEVNTSASGTGLGLAIVKRIIELMGGEIKLESSLNQGSTFSFTINAEEKSKHVSSVKPARGKKKKSLKPRGKNFRILVAEDELINFELLKEVLPAESEVEWARDGQEVIDAVSKDQNYDIVLMDLKMPEKTGYQALKEIRIIAPNLPVIAQTAYAMDGEKEAILEFGFDGYIPKPLKIPELLELINSLLRKEPT